MTNHPRSPFDSPVSRNVDLKVVEDFGKEWKAFNQSALSSEDLKKAFNQYFDIFPFDKINQRSVGFDMGCGSGRWAKLIAPKVARLNCIDPSSLALEQAKQNLKDFNNVEYECASVSETKIEDASQDFGYCLGVLHHIPDTFSGIKNCAQKLKSGAPFLVYLYYRFDNKPVWFQIVWKASDIVRRVVCGLPYPFKLAITQMIALFVYWPLSRLSLLLEKFGVNVQNVPLSYYRSKPLYFLRTDALDRFGTRLEKRFTKAEIEKMLIDAGFREICFSSQTPFWVAVAIKE
jgi:2-polyprenyl-3-methyl-5-hydroxy-6-metoxy-1,4-benzoquinol methylase